MMEVSDEIEKENRVRSVVPDLFSPLKHRVDGVIYAPPMLPTQRNKPMYIYIFTLYIIYLLKKYFYFFCYLYGGN